MKIKKKQKKILIISGVVVAFVFLAYFGGFFTIFYGLPSLETCTFDGNGDISCSVDNPGSWGSEVAGSSPNEIIPVTIGSPYNLYFTQLSGFINIAKSSDSNLATFLTENSFCKTMPNQGNWLYNGEKIASLCEPVKVCDYYAPPNNLQLKSCSCSLMANYDSSLSLLGISGVTGEECSGFVTWYPNTNWEHTQVKYYSISASNFVSSKFPNQLIIMEGVIQDKRENPTKVVPFKTYGICTSLIEGGVCNIHAPTVTLSEFPSSHGIVTSIKIIPKVGGYDENSVCAEENFEKCVNQNLNVCQNGAFVDKGKVEGKCEYTPPLDYMTFVYIAVIILAIGGSIWYMKYKK